MNGEYPGLVIRTQNSVASVMKSSCQVQSIGTVDSCDKECLGFKAGHIPEVFVDGIASEKGQVEIIETENKC
jgi:hypothetical protein